MKARNNKDIAINIKNENLAFIFANNSKEIITNEEYDLIIMAVLKKPSGKHFLTDIARVYSKRIPLLVALKKNADDERIVNIYCNVLKNSSNTNALNLFTVIVEYFISLINNEANITKNHEKLTQDILLSDTEDYFTAINIISDSIGFNNVIWFLKITGNAPNEKQLKIIQAIIDRHIEEEKNKENIFQIASEMVVPVAETTNMLEEQVNNILENLNNLTVANTAHEFGIEKINNKLESNISKIIEIRNETLDYQNSIDEITVQLNEINQTIKSVQEKISDQSSKSNKTVSRIEHEIQELRDSLKNTNKALADCNNNYNKIKEKNEDISNDISDLRLKITGNFDKVKSLNSAVQLKYYSPAVIEPAVIITTNLSQGDLNIFSDDLDDSFKNCNITCDANYITSVISSGCYPVFVGYSARETATIVSIVLTGETPTIVSLPTDYNNIAELESICCNSDLKAVLIEDCIGALRERILYPIFRKLRSIKNKPYLLLLCEDYEELELTSKSFYLHTALIQCSDPNVIVNYSEIDSCSIHSTINNLNELPDFKDNYRKFKRLLKDTDLSEQYSRIKSSLFRYYYRGTINELVLELIRNEMKIICNTDDLENKMGVKNE